MKNLTNKWYFWIGLGLLALAAVVAFGGDNKLTTTVKNILPGGTTATDEKTTA